MYKVFFDVFKNWWNFYAQFYDDLRNNFIQILFHDIQHQNDIIKDDVNNNVSLDQQKKLMAIIAGY